MWPGNNPSSVPVPSTFFGARARPITSGIDYEDGGIALADASKGLLYQQWKGERRNNEIWLSAPNTPETLVYSGVNVTDFSFTFDQNMRHVLVYVDDGVAYLEWYDSTVPGRVTTMLGAYTTPRIALDDKRKNQLGISDVILMYCDGPLLKYRLQRDRYIAEYTIPDIDATNGLVKIGMMRNLRFGWMLKI